MMHAFLSFAAAALLCIAAANGVHAQEAQAAPAPEQTAQSFSADGPKSLMFSSEEVSNLRRVLNAYLAARSGVDDPAALAGGDDELQALLAGLDKEEEGAPDPVLPDFYVSSVVWRNASDWAVWINQEKFTNRKRESLSQQIRITSVRPQKVSFVWEPQQDAAARQRYNEILNKEKRIGGDLVPEQDLRGIRPNPKLKHRNAAGASVSYDEDAKMFRISMLTNQTFAADTMSLYEGRYTTSRVIAQPAKSEDQVQGIASSEGDPNPLDRERALANELLGNVQQLQNFIPGQETE